MDKYQKIQKLYEGKLNEGYEKHCLEILDSVGIDGSFGNGILYVAKEDMKKAKEALENSGEIHRVPTIKANE